MPTPTYTPLATLTLSSSAASVTFSSISQAYRDLVLVIAPISSVSNMTPYVRYNGVSTAIYHDVLAAGDGSTTLSQARANNTEGYLGGYAVQGSGNILLNLLDYSTTDKHKSYLLRANNAATGIDMIAGRWANTAAITSMSITANTGLFLSGSTFALYGIAA